MLNFDYLNNLNEKQKEAVTYIEGPLLIVAGAGSGKTKVLTSRICHIILSKKALPTEVLAVTFTNKAANEMLGRILSNLKKKKFGMPWVGTFHSICVKILRKHARAANLNYNFTIVDQEDQKKLIKNICKSENVDTKKISPNYILNIIEKWKNKGWYPKDVVLKKSERLESSFLKIYEIYQTKLLDLNACDFNDLILHCIKIFESNPDITKMYSKNFKYILVDEYQDTNFIQSKWLNLLSQENKNICCVGDDDQSIYSWRGAEIKNFLEFDKIYENTKIIRLEKNYRSTQNILSVASSLISNNENRVGKTLFTDGEEGESVYLDSYRSGKDEAIGVGENIEKLKSKFKLNNISILVRAIFQTREFEERFLKIGLPYRIIGGTKFYERAEIKDCIAYLRIVNQPRDDLSLERIINVPKRSIGETSIKSMYDYAKKNNYSLEESAKKMIELNLIKPKTKLGLNSILSLLDKWRFDLRKKTNQVKLLQIILDESGYSQMLKDKKDLENENRIENIKELLNAMKEFDNLESFLEHVALATSIDQDWEGQKVNLMTMHSSKGLEFDVVFLPGWEEGLFPHQKSMEEKGQSGLEEERRLAYVGITRAKKVAFISFSMNRFYQGDWIDSISSRFIDELPEKNLEKNNQFMQDENDEFDFNQDIDYESEIKSPGWLRYQKRIKS
tara:strand:+ start:2815 stop:4842 length:2028 start_codon:yes stop_codon:yes gene_type:complete